jgi:hypothetical protein
MTRENQPAEARFVFLRAEGLLFTLRPFSLPAHYARNAQAFTERVYRLGGVTCLGLLRSLVSLEDPEFAARLMHLPLRRMSRDRLDLLGEEYFNYVVRPRLRPEGLRRVRELQQTGQPVVLVSQELDHLIRPLAQELKVEHLLTNRLEFRDGRATGRLLNPVVGALEGAGRLSPEERGEAAEWNSVRFQLPAQWQNVSANRVVFSAARQHFVPKHPVVDFGSQPHRIEQLSVRRALAGKKLLIIGTTGFIGKVWLAMLLEDLPDIGRIYLLVRRQGSRSALQRFERIVAESPTFKALHDRHGDDLGRWLSDRIEVLEGDVAEPGLGLDSATAESLYEDLDLVVNSAGLTDFNPDLRLALSTNADSVLHLVEFLRRCRRAGLVHVSTCFVNGRTDGRVPEELQSNYTPRGASDFNARHEWEFLHAEVDRIEQEAASPASQSQFEAEALAKVKSSGDGSSEKAVKNQIRKIGTRWVRDRLIDIGIARAQRWGWPNIYTFTKSLGESLLAAEARALPVSIARPSIVESSIAQPFRGWNEGVNTTAPLSYLLGTYFRQLPSNKRKRLDVIPVDLVCRGLTLIAAAVVQRCHERVYQLATSATNPADMRRTIELTGLAHRKHYRSLEGLEHWLRARFDTISVSKTRYTNVSLPRFRRLIEGTQRLLSPLSFKGEPLARQQRALEKVQKVIDLYEPFILDNEYFFAADHIKILAQSLPDGEEDRFGYDAESIDWYDYWINLHVPALRRWTYPLIEGRRPETGLLPRSFKLHSKTNQPEGAFVVDSRVATTAADLQPVNRAVGE